MTDTEIHKAVEILDDATEMQLREYYHAKPYLTSWDAIVPVIEKHWQACAESSNRTAFEICTPPRELCILLLKATGNWVDTPLDVK